MPTKLQIARGYAARLQGAASTAMTKSASAASGPPQEFLDAVAEVLTALDNISYAGTNTRLSEADREEICSLVDDELGVVRRSLWMVKKGSIKDLLTYQNLVMQLLTTITYG